MITVFMVVFFLLIGAASLGAIGPDLTDAANSLSRWLLVIAISAAVIKTNIADLAKLGWQPVGMLVIETGIIAIAVLILIVVGAHVR